MKFELRVEGLSSMAIAFAEDEDELMDVIDAVQWLGVENRIGEPIWVNTYKIVAFCEAE